MHVGRCSISELYEEYLVGIIPRVSGCQGSFNLCLFSDCISSLYKEKNFGGTTCLIITKLTDDSDD